MYVGLSAVILSEGGERRRGEGGGEEEGGVGKGEEWEERRRGERDERGMGWKKQESDDKKCGYVERNDTYWGRDRILD